MSYSRVSMPQGFYDKTSDMLLAAPEPQYLYAQMFKAALMASLDTPEELGLPGRSVGGAGADYRAAEADRLALSAPISSEIIAAAVDFNSAPGNTVRINRPVFENTTATEAARRIATGSSISTSAIAPTAQQVNLSLYRYGGPYDSTNSRVAPMGVEAFDANMGVHKASKIVGSQLRRDYDRFIDVVNVALLDLASTSVYPDGMSADNDATTLGSFPLTLETIFKAEQQAADAHLPTLPDGFRMLVLSPTQLRQLKLDADGVELGKAHPAMNAMFPQYVASISKMHVFESSTLNAPANSSSIAVHRGHLIAPGALLAGMGRPPRVAASTDDNYGETAKVIWLADHAFGLADNTFVLSVRSSA